MLFSKVPYKMDYAGTGIEGALDQEVMSVINVGLGLLSGKAELSVPHVL